MKDMKNNDSSNSFGMFLSGILTTVVVGGYLLFVSKNARSNRRNIDLWLEDVKDELYAKVKKMKNLTKEQYDETVDNLIDKYEEIKDVSKERAKRIKRKLKEDWEEVKKDLSEK